VERFRQEAQSATAIGNHHIIDISDFGVLPDGSTYFVMEFLDGISLTRAIEPGKPLKASRTIHIAKQLCRALGAAHDVGIVHRDLKPDNIYLISRGGDKDFVKVLDFGIAKVGGAKSKLTQVGQVFGTPHYMSPEQCAGTAVDKRTDVYALGVIMYEMASSRVPFDADNLMGILTKHLYEEPIKPHELPPPVDVPPALEAVIMKCLAKKADVRYQSMQESARGLSRPWSKASRPPPWPTECGATPRAPRRAVGHRPVRHRQRLGAHHGRG
jgi:serine/threonine-protein kinase